MNINQTDVLALCKRVIRVAVRSR